MSATEIVNEFSKLTEAERRVVLEKLRELSRETEGECTLDQSAIDLRTRGIDERQAADLRTRLKSFSEDWDRPEASVYDKDPAR